MKFKASDITKAGLFAALTVIISQISFTLPFSPVPITLQVAAVALSGAIAGSKTGMYSQLIYILSGVVGLPVFSGLKGGPGVLLGPTGGYIAAFPVAAYIIGLLVSRIKKRSFFAIWFSMLAGILIIYVIGGVWLSFSQQTGIFRAFIIGAGIFLPLDIVKTAAASAIYLRLR